MQGLIHFFINRSFVVNLLSAVVIIGGLMLGSLIKRDVTPPFEWKQVNVQVSLPGASATEVEQYLAYPIEGALNGLPHAKEILTKSESGTFKADIYFRADHDLMQESVETIRSRINAISWQLPEQVRNITVEQNKVDSVFFMGIALEGFDETNTQHRLMAQRLADEITATPGIVRSFVRMNPQNLYIKIKPHKIAENEISIAEVRQGIRQAMTFAPIGKVDFSDKSITVEVERPAEAVEAFKKLAARGNRSGDILYLGDLADVALEVDEIKERHRFNGKPTINLYVRKDISTDAIALKGTIKKMVEEFDKNLPEDQRAHIFLDTPHFIEVQLATLKNNGLFGMILVLVILTLFFNWKVSLATSFGIPIAYCGTLIALYSLGISIDLISVVGMILVLGILVDDAIIIAERYIENLEEGLPPKKAAFEASRDLMLPVTGTVLTTVFAFAPMLLVSSEIANIFYAIPVVIITSLVMSWLESFFILPNHLYHFIKRPPKRAEKSGLFEKVRSVYKKILAGALTLRYALVVFLVVFFAASAWVAKNKIQQNFNFSPSMERIAIKVILKENRSLEYTEKTLKPIEDYLMSLPKEIFPNQYTSIGMMWHHGRSWRGYRYAKLYLYIKEDIKRPIELKKKWQRKLRKTLRADFKTDAIEEISVGREMNDQDERKKDMVTIEVAGNEDVDYLALKGSIQNEIKEKAPGLKLVEDIDEFDEKWVFTPNTKRLAQHNLSLSGLTAQLRSFFVPHEIMQIRMHGETKWIYTQVDRKKTINKRDLNKMTVMNDLGLTVPLRQLGSWSKKQQLAVIEHKEGKRMFSFDLAFEPTDKMNMALAKDQGKAVTDTLAKKYPTYEVNLKDADRAEESSRAWALKVAAFCILLVMTTLALILNSITLPFIVGLPIPFGLMGIVWALYLHDMPMGIMALVGLVGTIGVSVNDSLIMVDQILKRGRRNGGLSRKHIIEGAAGRLRAIILTTVTTLGGVFPMAYGIGGESAFTQPLAFSIGWGLFFSTFLTLFALPAFIEIQCDFSRLGRWLKVKLWGAVSHPEARVEGSQEPSTSTPENFERPSSPTPPPRYDARSPEL